MEREQPQRAEPVTSPFLLSLIHVSVFRSLVLAVALASIAAAAAAWYLPPASPLRIWLPASWDRYLENSLCLAIVFVFLVLCIYAVFQHMGIGVDQCRLAHPQVASGAWRRMACVVSGRRQEALADRFDPGAAAATAQRLATDDQLRTRVASLRAYAIRKSLAPLYFGIWVLPVAGFIGTVLGVSEAIAGLHPLASATAEASGAMLGQSIRQVLQGLETAFDTTLFGLLCVVPSMLLTTHLRLRSERFDFMVEQAACAQMQ